MEMNGENLTPKNRHVSRGPRDRFAPGTTCGPNRKLLASIKEPHNTMVQAVFSPSLCCRHYSLDRSGFPTGKTRECANWNERQELKRRPPPPQGPAGECTLPLARGEARRQANSLPPIRRRARR